MNTLGEVGQQADRSTWIDHAARIGLVAYGIVHLTIAWLALQLAFGDREGKASSTGALRQLSEQDLGTALIWAIAVGMFLLVGWRVLEAFVGYQDEDGATLWRKRATSVLKAVIYGAIGVSAVKIAIGAGSSSGTDSTTAKLMRLPAGPWLVGLVGLAIAGYGIALVIRAWTEKFKENLTAEGRSGATGTAFIWFGKAGYTAKGVAFVLVGGLFLYAAVTHDPEKSGGLDQALQEILDQPLGPFLLAVIAVGIGCYGLFCFARARHLSR